MPYDGRLLSGVTVLMAVVEAGSMARAAEALGVTSSGVGRAVARLEARVGVRLLERTTRTMTLTDEGRRFRRTRSASPALRDQDPLVGTRRDPSTKYAAL